MSPVSATDCRTEVRRGRPRVSPLPCPSSVWTCVDRQSQGSVQGRINHSGAPYQRKAGALFSVRMGKKEEPERSVS